MSKSFLTYKQWFCWPQGCTWKDFVMIKPSCSIAGNSKIFYFGTLFPEQYREGASLEIKRGIRGAVAWTQHPTWIRISASGWGVRLAISGGGGVSSVSQATLIYHGTSFGTRKVSRRDSSWCCANSHQVSWHTT